MTTSIRLRRDQAVDWASVNPVLGNGEPGFEDDTGKFKIGNGVSRWLDLDYFSPSSIVETNYGLAALDAVEAHINSLTPHPVYDLDNGPSLLLLYQNAKV